jgi:DNA uptake protein ComE-like DNA-binding protein
VGRQVDNGKEPYVGRRQQKSFILLSLLLLILIVLPAVIYKAAHGDAQDCDSVTLPAFGREATAFSDSLDRMKSRENAAYHARYASNQYRHGGANGYRYGNADRYSRYKNTVGSPNQTDYHPDGQQNFPTNVAATATVGTSIQAGANHYHREREHLSFELNSADTLDLQQLRGIGPAYARRIVNYRNALGGYVNKEQLKEVYGFPVETYTMVAPHLTLDNSHIRKLNPNTASLAELKNHPYLDYYQARAIVDYRKKGHIYHCANDLLMVNLITENVVEKLLPYLSF